MKKHLDWFWRGSDSVGGSSEVIPTASVSASLNSGTLTATYSYSDANSDLEQNEKPEVRGAYISGLPKVGEVLTANYTFYSKHGYAFSSVSYQWYRADNYGGIFDHDNPLTLISGQTSSTYTCVSADVGKYIFCKIVVTQSGGGNTTSADYYTYTTDDVLSAVFDPVELGFAIALQPANMSDNGTTFTWTNTGTKGGSVTATGTARPTIISGKADFVTDDRLVGAILPASGGRYEIWVRVRKDTITSQQRVYVLGSDSKTMNNTTGTPKKIRIIGTTQDDHSGVPPLDNNERIYRVRFDGIGGKYLQVDKDVDLGTYYINESFTGQNNVGLTENQNLVLGSNLAGSGNFLDGTIDHFYILPNGELSEQRADLMWEYIQNN